MKKMYGVIALVCATVVLAGCGTRNNDDDVQTSVRMAPSADAATFDCNGQVMRVDLLRNPVRAQVFFEERTHDPIVLDLVSSDDTATTYITDGVSLVMRDDASAALSLIGEASTVTCTEKE